MKSLFILYFSILTVWSFSQDTLYFRDGRKQAVLIKEFNYDIVRYKSLDTLQSMVYVGSNEKIYRIFWVTNGTSGKYYDLPEPKNERSDKIILGQRNDEDESFNRVGVDLYDAFFGNVAVYYQHTFKKANFLTLGIPYSFSPAAVFSKNYDKTGSVNDEYNFYSRYKIYSSGIELTSYPKGFIYGGAFDFGFKKYLLDSYTYDPATGGYTIVRTASNAPFMGIFVRLGYDATLFKKLGFGIYANLGLIRSTVVVMANYTTDPDPVWVVQKNQNYGLGLRVNLRLHYSF